MDYKQKYLKYKKKYLQLNTNNIKSFTLSPPKIMTGGNISWATQDYIESIISSQNPDLSKCDFIKDILPKGNEGRHNDGIGFVTIEGNEYFLKYGVNLFEEFKTGYMLSKLKSEYPYFLNVHSLFKCDYIPRGKKESINGQVMIIDKGRETIYNYLNRKSKDYILKLIPDLENRINELDKIIIKIINDNLTIEEKNLSDWELKKANQKKYDYINSEMNELIKSFYLSLSKEIIQFQTEFVPLFLRNYKTLIDSNMIVDIFTLNKYNSYVTDKKSDNFMVIIEPFIENKTHINIKLGSKDIKINNVCTWHDTKEYCFVYPVDFGSGNISNHSKLDEELLSYFLNQWISFYSRLFLYSDNRINNLESDNILSLNKNVELIFSKFASDNNITKLNFGTIFAKYNPFKIKIFNPLESYFEGKMSMIDNAIHDKELQRLLNKNPLGKNDYRFQMITKKLFNINNLEEACEILQILLDGNSVIYDNYLKKYRSYSNTLDFYTANGLSKNYIYFNDDDIYKTFSSL